MDGQAVAAAGVAFGRGDYLGVLSLLSPWLGTSADAAPLVLLGDALAHLGLPAEAAQVFEQAAACPGADVSASLSRATALYVEAGDDDRAQLIGIKLLDAMPGDACLAYHLALSFRRTGDTGLVHLLVESLAKSGEADHLKLAGEILSGSERQPSGADGVSQACGALSR